MIDLNLVLDINNNQEKPTLILCNRELKKQGTINSYKDLTTPINFNDVNGISFSIDKENCVLFDSIVDFKIVYVKELNAYYEIQVSFTSSTLDEKAITGTYLPNAELSQINLYGIEINTDVDIAREDYLEPTIIYDPLHPENSLLDRILGKAPHYTVKYVDTTIRGLIRSFSIDDTSIDDFLRSTLAQEINCLVDYDSYDRSISLYDLESNCLELSCLYRGEFTGVCPVCGSTNITEGYGEDTSVFLSKDNLIESVTLEGDKDSVKNCFRIVGADDLMTSAVASYNPNGSNYIYLFSDETKADMPVDLVDKLDDYDVLYNSYKAEYSSLMEEIYNNIDESLYLTSGMQPTIPAIETTATEELVKLTYANIGSIGVGDISYASLATVNNAVIGVAEIFMTQGYKVEIVSSVVASSTWSGKFKVTNIADDTDVATNSVNIDLPLTQDLLVYTQQKIDKMLKKKTVTDEIIEIISGYYYNNNFYKESSHTTLIVGEAGVLYVDLTTGVTTNCSYLWTGTAYDVFWNRYCLNRLSSFETSFQSCLDIIIEKAGAGLTTNSVLYPMYLKYYRLILDIQREMSIRESEIKTVDTETDTLTARQLEIQDILDMEKYLGTSLWLVFSSYRREDTYQNDNYSSEGLDTAELFNKAEELFNVASTEIIKASKLQLTLSGTFKNLLSMSEFEPVWDKFKLGNWIRVEVAKDIYKLRLVSIDNNYEDPANASITFSDIVKVKTGTTDVKSILDKASSVASSYSGTVQQASQGKEANAVIGDFRTQGLDSSLYKVINAKTQDVVFDEHGITCKSYDDVIQDYLPEQVKIVNNVIAFTNDNWSTLKTALGKMPYTINGVAYEGYGLNSEFVIAGLIQGGDIYSSNYSSTVGALAGTHIDLNTGNFTFAGGKLTYNGTTLDISGKITATTGSIGGWNLTSDAIYRGNSTWGNIMSMYFGVNGLSITNQFKVSAAGNITATGATISGNITATTLTATSTGSISSWNFNSSCLYKNSDIWGALNGSYFGNNGLSISDKFKVDAAGNITATSAIITGTINATILNANNSGNIAGWDINPNRLSSEGTDPATCTSKVELSKPSWVNGMPQSVFAVYNTDIYGWNRPFSIDSLGNIDSYGDAYFRGGMYITQDLYVGAGSSGIESKIFVVGGVELSPINPSIYHGGYIDFHFRASAADYTSRIIETSSGNVVVYNTITSVSDRELKKDEELIDDSIKELYMKLKPKTFKFKSDEEEITEYGFIAQDIEESLAECSMDIKDFGILKKNIVDENSRPVYSVGYSNISALNMYFIQQLLDKNDEQDKKIAELKSLLDHTRIYG